MKSIYFNEREKRLYNSFSKKNDYYKDCYLGETKPILDRKIKHLEKQMLDKCKAQLKVLKKKEEREELQRFINLFEEPKNVGKEIIPETNKVVEEQFIKRLRLRKKTLLSSKQSDLGLITVDMFIGVIHSSLLIRANSVLLRAGG
jgi:SpoVK/Ycf46/Vps4 family AAA+-type ATPase